MVSDLPCSESKPKARLREMSNKIKEDPQLPNNNNSETSKREISKGNRIKDSRETKTRKFLVKQLVNTRKFKVSKEVDLTKT